MEWYHRFRLMLAARLPDPEGAPGCSHDPSLDTLKRPRACVECCLSGDWLISNSCLASRDTRLRGWLRRDRRERTGGGGRVAAKMWTATGQKWAWRLARDAGPRRSSFIKGSLLWTAANCAASAKAQPQLSPAPPWSRARGRRKGGGRARAMGRDDTSGRRAVLSVSGPTDNFVQWTSRERGTDVSLQRQARLPKRAKTCFLWNKWENVRSLQKKNRLNNSMTLKKLKNVRMLTTNGLTIICCLQI